MPVFHREVREERLENFESRSDLVTCVFFMADLDPETTSGGSRSAVGGGAGGTSGSANIMASGGSSTLPHIITLHNFWIRLTSGCMHVHTCTCMCIHLHACAYMCMHECSVVNTKISLAKVQPENIFLNKRCTCKF